MDGCSGKRRKVRRGVRKGARAHKTAQRYTTTVHSHSLLSVTLLPYTITLHNQSTQSLFPAALQSLHIVSPGSPLSLAIPS